MINAIATALTCCDFKKLTINLKYGVLITNLPLTKDEVDKQKFLNKFSMFQGNNPAEDYLVILTPEKIIFSSYHSSFTLTNFNLFMEMTDYFDLRKEDINNSDEDIIKENNIKNILTRFFNDEAKGNIFLRDKLAKYITEDFSKKADVWLKIDNINRNSISIENLRITFVYNEDVIYNALIENDIDLLTMTAKMHIKFDPYTTVEFKERPLMETHNEFYLMNSDNGLDYNIKFNIERDITTNIFTDIESMLTKFVPVRTSFPIDRNSNRYSIYYNMLSLLK